MKALRPTDPEVIVAEWQRRCRRYRSWNRLWVRVAVSWLIAIGATFCWGALRDPAGYFYAGLLFAVGFPVFAIASLRMPRLLRCPQCERSQSDRLLWGSGKPEDGVACKACAARFI
jgi:hypothetical protein